MKLPKLFLRDYLVAIALILVIAVSFSAAGFTGTFFIIFITLLVVGGLVLAGKFAYKFLMSSESKGISKRLSKFIFTQTLVLAQIVTFFSLLVVCAKLAISAMDWLKYGVWGYQHDSACYVFNFTCYGETDFVKINQFLGWIYTFDAEVWIIGISWLIYTAVFLMFSPNEED